MTASWRGAGAAVVATLLYAGRLLQGSASGLAGRLGELSAAPLVWPFVLHAVLGVQAALPAAR